MKNNDAKVGLLQPSTPANATKEPSSMDAPHIPESATATRDSLYEDMSVPVEKKRRLQEEAIAISK